MCRGGDPLFPPQKGGIVLRWLSWELPDAARWRSNPRAMARHELPGISVRLVHEALLLLREHIFSGSPLRPRQRLEGELRMQQ
jgi:hypothetical protein